VAALSDVALKVQDLASSLWGENKPVEMIGSSKPYVELLGKLEKVASFADGKLDGVCSHWYENGELQEKAVFSKGVPDGPWEKRFPSGKQTSIGTYQAGKREGPWFYYKEDGTPDDAQSGVYVADQRTGPLPADAAKPAMPEGIVERENKK